MIEASIKSTTVLLVEDDHDDYLLTRDILGGVGGASYHVVWVDTYERAIEELHNRPYDVVLVDYLIGKRTGLDFIREVGRLHPDCPMILLTGLGSVDVDTAAQEAGAADYIIKDQLTEALLDRSIRYACQQARRTTLLNALLTNATAGMVATDGEGRPLVWNQSALIALDVDPAPVTPEAVGSALQRAYPDCESAEEICNRHGNTFEISASSIPGGGRMIVFHDVTHRKENENLLRRAAADAGAANEAKSRFLANFSHELRTPLAGILGMVRVLDDSGISQLQRDYLETVKSCGLNLLAMINDILDLSKIEAGHVTLERVEYEPSALVDDLVRLLAPVAFEKGIEIAAFVDPMLPRTLRGDPHRLRQVLTNLIGNAIKFTETGAVTVRVAAEASGLHPAALRFDVVDCGIGIPKERAQSLFQRFTQVDASTTRRYGGTGLGLALSRELVELLGGRIWFESKVGEGSIFSFTVPLEVVDNSGSIHQQDTSALRGNVLFVSPGKELRNVVAAYIRAVGGQLTVACDAKAARDALHDRLFSLVIVDATLEMSVVEDIKRLAAPKMRTEEPSFFVLEKYGANGTQRQESLQRPFVRATLDDVCRQLLNVPLVLSPKVERAVAARSGQLRILVAEDNTVNQKLMTMLLQKLGYESEIAGDGRQVLAACAKTDFDVILMDLNMPVMDGIEATIRLRQQTATRTIPIIGLTATTQAIELKRCYAAGMNSVLNKPIDWDHLSSLLEALASSKSAACASTLATVHTSSGVIASA